MIIALGKIFGMSIERSAAASIIKIGLAVTAGRQVATTLGKVVGKLIPGVNIAVSAASAATAAVITEGLGWLVAEDFYRMSIGQEPEGLVDAAGSIQEIYAKAKGSS
jgi:uncharacterized protein (DUF697 family)